MSYQKSRQIKDDLLVHKTNNQSINQKANRWEANGLNEHSECVKVVKLRESNQFQARKKEDYSIDKGN